MARRLRLRRPGLQLRLGQLSSGELWNWQSAVLSTSAGAGILSQSFANRHMYLSQRTFLRAERSAGTREVLQHGRASGLRIAPWHGKRSFCGGVAMEGRGMRSCTIHAACFCVRSACDCVSPTRPTPLHQRGRLGKTLELERAPHL